MDHEQQVPPFWSEQPSTEAVAAARLAWCAAVARRAPSKHNTQPWRFVLQHDHLEVWTDPARTLATTDPRRREVLIACGAAVHFAEVASRSLGYPLHVEWRPAGPGGPEARLTALGRCAVTEHDQRLLSAIRDRRTDRGPLDGEPLPADLPFLLQSAAVTHGAVLRLVRTPGDRATLAALVAQADRLLARAGASDAELAPWLREPGDPRLDGIPTDHTRGAAASYRAEFVQRDFSTSTSQPGAYQPRPDQPLLGVLCTKADGPQDWLCAGQALGAVLLRATLAGAHASYLNQPVEHTDSRVLLRDQLSLDGVAQLVLRIGVGSPVSPTGRRDVDDVVLRT